MAAWKVLRRLGEKGKGSPVAGSRPKLSDVGLMACADLYMKLVVLIILDNHLDKSLLQIDDHPDSACQNLHDHIPTHLDLVALTLGIYLLLVTDP